MVTLSFRESSKAFRFGRPDHITSALRCDETCGNV
jgi:hypothetical protein